MLNKETLDKLKETIREINKLKNLDDRLAAMIKAKDELRNAVNEELDDLFASVNIKRSRLNMDEE
jgi:hypothetical protein